MKKQFQLLALMAASAAFTISSCKKEEQNITSPAATQNTSDMPDLSEKKANPDESVINDGRERLDLSGYLYTETNATSQNEILCYRQHADGSLTLEATVASGGTGVGAGPMGLGLDGQGAVALSENHEWLFAVNAGSNSISVFRVNQDGSLLLSDTKASGGTIPVSICNHHQYVYVVNAGTGTINGYTLGLGGTFEAIVGSNLPLSAAMADPAQIAFSPNGEYLYVTEKRTSKISSYEVDANGLATADIVYSSTGVTPFGFCHARDNYMVVSNANLIAPGVPVPGGASCTSYSGSNPGDLSPQNGAVPNNQSASCWVATTKYGRFAFISNTGSNDISSYYVSPWGSIYLVHGSAVSTGAGSAPKDLCVAANNFYVYNLNTMTHTIGGYHRAILGDLVSIGTTPGLPDYATGLVAW